MRYKLITLSPVHIGNGQQISNWSYADENNKVSIYNFEKVIKDLKYDSKKLINLTAEIERHPLTKSLKEILDSFGIKTEPEYTIPLRGKIKKQRWDRNRHQNITEYKPIWEFIKENGKVYIPGSEIKGAIRTALFYKILKDKFKEDERLKNKFLEEYENCIRKGGNIKKNFSRFEKRWESIVFRAGFKKAFDKDFQFEDAKKDILKILLISDTDIKQPEEVLEVKAIKPIGVSKGFEEPHEVLKKNIRFSVDLRIPFKEEYKKIFPETYVYLGLKKLRNACSEFLFSLIEEEITYFRNSNDLNNQEKNYILKILSERKKFIENAEKQKVIVLRLGKHQGFLSTTINLLIKEVDPKLYSKTYKDLVPRGYSKLPNKSRKITIDNELLGWCVLIPQ